MEAQSISEEQLFIDLRSALNQDIQDKCFVCQNKFYTLTEKYVLYISSKSNFWVLPLTIFTKQTLDHTKTISPPHLEINFLDSGATFNVLNNDTWNEIKEYHKLQSKASIFVLSAANNSRFKPNGTVKPIFYPDVTEQ